MTLQVLDPSISEAISLIDLGDLTTEKLADLRIDFSIPVPDSVEWSDVDVPGDPDIIVRIYRSRESVAPAPCIYSMHGGGYVLGSREIDNALFAKWCPELGVVGVSVEYRLAPETPYPGPLEDCYRGLVWCYEHADELGIDRNRIGVAGISAGGGLAAALALTRPRPRQGAARLSAPRLPDARRPSTDGVQPARRASRLESPFERVRMARRIWVRSTGATTSPRRQHRPGLPISPVFRRHSCQSAPSTGSATRTSTTRCASTRRGIPTELHVYPGLCHGYQIALDSPAVQQPSRDTTRWLRQQLQR